MPTVNPIISKIKFIPFLKILTSRNNIKVAFLGGPGPTLNSGIPRKEM